MDGAFEKGVGVGVFRFGDVRMDGLRMAGWGVGWERS